VAEEAGVLGFVAVALHEDSATGEIDMIAVDPEHQGVGVGTALMTFALEAMRLAECSLAVSAPAATKGARGPGDFMTGPNSPAYDWFATTGSCRSGMDEQPLIGRAGPGAPAPHARRAARAVGRS
jgi:GNAT superfamily N-acetyltransferase